MSLCETMGVQKLDNLVDESKLLEDITLKNTDIVIDAPNVYYFLYFNSVPKLDQSHGGDYSGFKEEVCRFFQALQDCKVTPHVILDGGSGPEKFETLKSRLQNKLVNAKKMAEGSPDSNILPPLIKDVFKQVLTERNLQFEESFGEADPRIASLANELGCPVLSHDSDFYIYDLEGGVLPPSKFLWKVTEGGQITAKCYRRSEFCTRFSIDPALMSVFASIAGNDYSRLEDKGKFVKKYPPCKMSNNWKLDRLRALLEFLSTVNLRNLQDSEEKQKKALKEAFMLVNVQMDERPFLESIRKYNIGPVKAETHGGVLAQWMCDKIQEGKLTSFVTDVLHHKRMMLTPLVEDFSQPSSYSAALHIRQYFYGLLLGQELCTEFDRVDEKSVSQKDVRPLHPSVSQDKLQQLQLQHLDQAPEDLRRHVLMEALESPDLVLGNVPDHMKLPLCVTNFWWKYRQRNHTTAPNKQYVCALLLGFVYGEHLDPRGEFNRRMEALKDEGNMLQLQPDVAHAFCQWQCCFRQSLHLNQLLCFPLTEPYCSRLYCGPLLHRLTAESEIKPDTIKGLMNEKQRGLFDIIHHSLEHEALRQERRGRKHKIEKELDNNMQKKNRHNVESK
ncbi:single-strand DNA endonuclease ASTE1-like isoform X2 [Channa argus]|uniref:single-strand DNA endonuclease ASTE1-like isoform X2 n=1 Tax=Channa argus TaxID=215402 RepID=UPI00351F9CBD